MLCWVGGDVPQGQLPLISESAELEQLGVTATTLRAALPHALQLCLGFCLPLIAQAVLESRMFRQHQRQRREEGLLHERGWQAAMYEGIAECWAPFHGDAPLLLGLATGLPCLLWQFALMLTGAESLESSVAASGDSSPPCLAD